MAFFSNKRSIRKGVMQVINEKVNKAQEAHDAECDALDSQCEAQKEAAERARDAGKEASAQKHITSIIGRLL